MRLTLCVTTTVHMVKLKRPFIVKSASSAAPAEDCDSPQPYTPSIPAVVFPVRVWVVLGHGSRLVTLPACKLAEWLL